jgi:EAL domain-containing protein (putative c-di-GMP-specific phosphodiesterase class I)/GGDEF domain-containing protein
MAEQLQEAASTIEVEIAYDNQKIIEKLNNFKLKPDLVLSKLKIDTPFLTSQQLSFDESSYLYALCDSLKNGPLQYDIDSFTDYINQVIYLWLSAIDEGALLETTLKLVNCFTLKNHFGLNKTSQFGQFLHSILIESLNRYHQVTIDYVMNFDESVQLPNTNLLSKNLTVTLNQAKEDEITALFSIHFQTDNNMLLLPKSSSQELNAQIVSILKKNINQNSQLYFNGDYQFELLIPQINQPTQLDLLVAKIFRAFEELVYINRQSILVKPHIGCSYSKNKKLSAAEISRNAKKALEYAINKRQPYVVYGKELEQKINDQIVLESRIMEAFDTNNLILNFQPIVDLNTNQCAGAELLLRWSEKFGHIVAPNIAVEILNSLGKGKLFTRWLINTACRYVFEINNNHNLDIYLTLNLRAEDLHDPELPSLFSNALTLWKMNPNNLILEITENGFLEHNEQTQSVINALSQLGFKFALDDFGTGFSSLSRLRKLPIDIIKIDQSFVKNIRHSREDYEIVQSIAMLAKSLGKEVLTEGIEDAATLAMIKNLNIDKCQGYYYAKALHYDDFIKWVQAF